MKLGFEDIFDISCLDKIFEKDTWKVLCFSGKAFPGAFLKRWRETLSKKLGIRFKYVSCEGKKIPKQLCQQSFWGNEDIYWLGEITSEEFLKKFGEMAVSGKVVCFSSKKVPDGWVSRQDCFVANLSGSYEMEVLAKFFEVSNISAFLRIVKKLQDFSGNISLEQFSHALEYSQLVGGRNLESLVQCLCELSEKDPRLSELSENFLCGNSSEFFKLWDEIVGLYSLPFWISFFTRILWNCACYVQTMSLGFQQVARSTGFRLPRKFQSDLWRKFSVKGLSELYREFYLLDCSFKTSVISEAQIESLFAKHFRFTEDPQVFEKNH
ncbi:hypothetical protein ACFLY6_01155 [Candidatus Dependentiae bacterium]